ncbi:MAG: hypothetical protein FGM15_02725 [Chthoniobacterales bacterium]|nr:hypothetical protein [Chthoniobacterales bacterium]
MTGEAPDLAALSPAAGALIAIPVRRVFSLSFWAPSGDPAIFPDLVFTQLELRGLAGRSRDETAFAWSQVAASGDEALLHAVVLPAHLAPGCWHGEATEYAVSPGCLPLPADSVTVWKEEGVWVAAVTRGDHVVHFQSLTSPQPSGAMALEVWTMVASLEAGGMTAAVRGVRLLYEGGRPDLRDWPSGGFLPVELAELPPPVRPSEPLKCIPLPVRDAQQAKKAAARTRKIVLAAAAAYFVLMLALVADMFWLQWRARSLRASIDREAGDVAAVQAAMDRWDSLLTAIDRSRYPLEILYQVVRLLPEDGVRLVSFNMDLDRVSIAGEASQIQQAQKFQEDVSKSPELAELYRWDAQQPKLIGTGSARFQVDGVRADFEGEAQEQTNESTDF